MRVEFIPHALDRMRRRGITVEQVLTVLRALDATGLPADHVWLAPALLPGAWASELPGFGRSRPCWGGAPARLDRGPVGPDRRGLPPRWPARSRPAGGTYEAPPR